RLSEHVRHVFTLLSIILHPPRPTLFPYTTLFRSLAFGTRVIVSRATTSPIQRIWRPKHRPASQNAHSPSSLGASPVELPALSGRSEEHTSELQSLTNLVCRLLLAKKQRQQDSAQV